MNGSQGLPPGFPPLGATRKSGDSLWMDSSDYELPGGLPGPDQ